MGDNRRKFSDNEKMLLFKEVGGRCPICGKVLFYKKQGKINRAFEVAHIYPANPRPKEITLLENEEKLSDNINALENVIAVCRICHKKFDTPRTLEEYRSWVRLKKKLLEDAEIKNTYELFNVEEEIKIVLESLNNENNEAKFVELSYDSLKIDEKANKSLPFILKKTIKKDVADYFYFIRNLFVEIDKSNPYKFETIASEIKSFYFKCMQINNNQEKIYISLVEWLNEKTNRYSERACQIIIAYFIQNCEVFS